VGEEPSRPSLGHAGNQINGLHRDGKRDDHDFSTTPTITHNSGTNNPAVNGATSDGKKIPSITQTVTA
jgi:hypothetical protein